MVERNRTAIFGATTRCSIPLSYDHMVARGGVEPPLGAYKAPVLPLNYRAAHLVAGGRIELPAQGYEPCMLPLHQPASLVPGPGIEPGPCAYETHVQSQLHHPGVYRRWESNPQATRFKLVRSASCLTPAGGRGGSRTHTPEGT